MSEENITLRQALEDIKNTDTNGADYWIASELMLCLDYSSLAELKPIIDRAQSACANSHQEIENHFLSLLDQDIGKEYGDWELSRYACYLIALNGNPEKPKIAAAQTYFATQTRKQEKNTGVVSQISEKEKRLLIRAEVVDHNKRLQTTAMHVGVKNFGVFNDAGYVGLYGMKSPELAKYKGVGKTELLDRAGSTELAANLFRITQTDEKLTKDSIKGEREASMTHWIVGDKIRKIIRELRGTFPEELEPEEHIKEIRTEIGKTQSKSQKSLFSSL